MFVTMTSSLLCAPRQSGRNELIVVLVTVNRSIRRSLSAAARGRCGDESLQKRERNNNVNIMSNECMATEIQVEPEVLYYTLALSALALRAARVRRGADTAGTGVQGEPRRFYVNEHLTYNNRKLFFAAREKLGRSKNWRFVWTRAGHVYARRDNKSKVVNIKSEDDINKVFYS
ncbi:unnamed protein product [Colias eurytheme]|nr:unnamed protein product [Colias eurytheme]